ncbi:hypothetical protein K438DRAFT_603177 [Mycena galopus ATCC 62051]|nr:hypothetical protein K438DRAFT_603177 [Mycena galopus ATCC 62051]
MSLVLYLFLSLLSTLSERLGSQLFTHTTDGYGRATIVSLFPLHFLISFFLVTKILSFASSSPFFYGPCRMFLPLSRLVPPHCTTATPHSTLPTAHSPQHTVLPHARRIR